MSGKSSLQVSHFFPLAKRMGHQKLDFPDIHGGWVAPEGTMGDVVTTLEKMYGAAVAPHLPRDQGNPRFWPPRPTTGGGKETGGGDQGPRGVGEWRVAQSPAPSPGPG